MSRVDLNLLSAFVKNTLGAYAPPRNVQGLHLTCIEMFSLSLSRRICRLIPYLICKDALKFGTI